MAQLVEQRIRNAWVRGSSPLGSFFVFKNNWLSVSVYMNYEKKEMRKVNVY